ncbi:L-glutamine synthetase [Palleronia marisminoris]|uniref:Gamma-glutamylputrescine synthetase PuuA n=1 Tax=Palleronia marisminoris TaxID=315423 RepID=A0A1Y5RTK1_9RHOB|nr:glutamine synthetase family protein [Palleronia marisminoris]SFG48883.1 L-glutamine synthetase [Palleronia marisminoris]SLN25146.1 Gamma-glutamylputrescine synthetase PuuA [Palleronia marisminoris]
MTDWLDQAPEAARLYLNGKRPEEIECMVSDLPGIARGKAMPAGKFARQSRFFLPRTIFHQTITGGWATVPVPEDATEPDMILTPDYSTATAAPWTADRTLQVIHDMELQEGGPVPAAPRNVLKRVVAAYEARGLTPVVAPEMEFYLVARNTDPGHAIEPMIGRTGRAAAARQAYSLSAVDEYGGVIDDIYDFAEAQGFEIDGITQEGGAGQLEINLRHGSPVKLADEIFFFKRLIREAALRHNCFATFMAKPIENEPGSSMHIHHSIIDADGRNIFSGPNDEETDAFRHFIGGLQHHLPSVTALLAPYVNSYRRYVKEFAAPVNLEWGRDNRTAGLRIPIAEPQARRIENRIAGMDCNPYLGIAASLACGLLGMDEQREPREECNGDAYDSDQGVPRGLFDALELFDSAHALHDLLSPEFAKVYSVVKRTEYDEYLQAISPWEREHLLINV